MTKKLSPQANGRVRVEVSTDAELGAPFLVLSNADTSKLKFNDIYRSSHLSSAKRIKPWCCFIYSI